MAIFCTIHHRHPHTIHLKHIKADRGLLRLDTRDVWVVSEETGGLDGRFTRCSPITTLPVWGLLMGGLLSLRTLPPMSLFFGGGLRTQGLRASPIWVRLRILLLLWGRFGAGRRPLENWFGVLVLLRRLLLVLEGRMTGSSCWFWIRCLVRVARSLVFELRSWAFSWSLAFKGSLLLLRGHHKE